MFVCVHIIFICLVTFVLYFFHMFKENAYFRLCEPLCEPLARPNISVTSELILVSGLVCKSAAWKAAVAFGKHLRGIWKRPEVMNPCPGEGKMGIQGSRTHAQVRVKWESRDPAHMPR